MNREESSILLNPFSALHTFTHKEAGDHFLATKEIFKEPEPTR